MFVHDADFQCSGCGLCAHMCPHHAITMTVAADGFAYPKIDSTICTDCGVCKAVCPFNESTELTAKTTEAYGLKHSESVRKESSSGGFFTLLSDYVLQNGGVIYGAVWTEDYTVTHIRADNAADRDRMRGSKYVQSDISGIFQSLKVDVSAGKLALFTGTPCQCAAVLQLFGKKRPDNLLVMDVICHGVLPKSLFDEYLAYIRKKNPDKTIESINLRDKRYGWQSVGIGFTDGSVYHSAQDYFYKVYAMHALQRPSCFSCACARQTRFSDFTVGDFWGIQKSHPELYDDLGVSLVLVNTHRAKQLMPKLAENVEAVQVAEETYLPFQPNLCNPTRYGKRAKEFKNYYQKHGYEQTAHRFFDVTLTRRINALGYKILKKILHK